MLKNEWKNFKPGNWMESIDVRDFIQKNYTPYLGDSRFLSGASEKTKKLWNECLNLISLEAKKGGVLSVDPNTVSTLTAYKPAYIDKDLEVIYGLQTEKPLERGVNPFGGIRMAKQACQAYGYKLNPEIDHVFNDYSKTHNQGVFDVYTEDVRKARSSAIITGLPDAYGRGRIIGDYRRAALYGIDFLIEQKANDFKDSEKYGINSENIRRREEITDQINALKDLKIMAEGYGFDIGKPAKNAKEAVQWLYFAYLGAIKEQNGAAMSLGRTSTFLDIYIERDLKEGILTEKDAQEIIDQFIIKLRLARELRIPEYNELFGGDPLWITESIGGIGLDGRPLVTKNSFRYLNTLIDLGPAPEPNLTILWSPDLPKLFKDFCGEISLKTNAVQYENDELMRPVFGDDYGIACCVSAMAIGKQMQFFGARCNLAKTLLLAINGGRDEIKGIEIVPHIKPLKGEYLNYDDVIENFKLVQSWVCKTYIDALNIIHYMHDKYCYEKILMAFHDTEVKRFMAFGVAGLSVCCDSLSAIKYAKVKPIRDENGISKDFEIHGEYPAFGNDDDRCDNIAVDIVTNFKKELEKHALYRKAEHTLSVLTITSNVMYGKKTGATPDGRKKGEPFAPGANPMGGRDKNGVLASLNSVAKLPYSVCRDGISCTTNFVPSSLGKTNEEKVQNLTGILDGYFKNCGHHINVNIINRETLKDAMVHPEKYPQLTIRVSGYAVRFNSLTLDQKKEVISRTYHER